MSFFNGCLEDILKMSRISVPFSFDHLEKKEVSQLLDIIAAIDSIMPQGEAEAPEGAKGSALENRN